MEASSQDLHDKPIKELISPVHTISEDISVAAALDQFIKRKDHLFIVVDEYGSTGGLVSLEDTIETLLGVEIVDEFDSVEDMRAYALEQWRIKKQKLRPRKA
jgi:CBS domain containing-hemolysin-like protein